ncbi:hypothetical protein BTO01_22625, partial [Vibrio jasicida]|uniref:hypothetical protein n=1 Tax=Vibrio jasicida TaxID=766224 RepID=UPI000D4EA003
MAVSPIKLALMGVLVAGAVWMGYTTLFPEQTSVYSEQASHTSDTTNTGLTVESASITESAPTTTLSEQEHSEGTSSEAPLGAINQALADKIAKLG